MSANDLIEQIKAAAKDQRVNQKALADVAGMPSQSAISNVFKGKRKLTIEEATKLKAYLGIAEGPKVDWVPVIGLAAAGNWNEAVLMPARSHPIPSGVAGHRAFAVEVRGDSMDLLLPEGGWAVIDPDQRRLFSGKVYLIQNDDHDATIKRYRSDPARFEPVSRNHLHEAFEVGDIPYTVIGRVVSYGNTAGL
jgi:SOS-response transcriptional repressor LexA